MFLIKKTVRIVIKNQNLALEVNTGTNLYQALVNEGIIPATLCRGNGQCGKCKVHISQKNMSRPNKKEQLVLARLNLDAGFRLACQTVIKDTMVVDTSEITSLPVNNDYRVKPIYKDEPTAKADEAITTAINEAEDVSQAKDLVEPKAVTEPEKPKGTAVWSKHQTLDGLLLIQNKNQLRFFLYSSVIDNVSQEGFHEQSEDLVQHVKDGTLPDYVHDLLYIKDIDRIIIMSDQISTEGENLFDMVSYLPFDIGAMQCELIRPLPETGDFSLFLRILSQRGRNRLMVSMDKPEHTYYVGESKVVLLHDVIGSITTNLLDVVSFGTNPIVSVSDDLRKIKAANEFMAPDSIPLPMLIRAAALMVKHKLADSELRIYSRTQLESAVPLEYIVKVIQQRNGNAFYLYRDRDSSLLITQEMLNSLIQAKRYMHSAIKYTEAHLGNIETIMICTPTAMPGLLESMSFLELVPKRLEKMLTHNAADSAVTAIKLFQEPDVRAYVRNHFGTFVRSE